MDDNNSPNILKYKIDRYHAATFSPDSLPSNAQEFDIMLGETMAHLTTVHFLFVVRLKY